MHALEAVDLYRFFHAGDDETLALRGVSVQLDGGELVAVVGPSGSGKSTLIACLAGLDEPDGGHVDLLGERLTRRPEAERASRRAASIGLLLQTGNLFDHLCVEDNIRAQVYLSNRPSRQPIDGLLESVGLGGRGRALVTELSGGEAARAGLAVALSTDPAVLLADEPTGEVDADTERIILQLLEARREHGAATLVTTHSDAVMARADRIVRLLDGRVVNG